MAFILSAPIVLAAVIALSLLHRLGLIIYRLYFHPLAKFPGPKHMVVSSLPLAYSFDGGDFYKDARDLHNQYGNIVRIAPNELSVDGSIGWNDAFGHKKLGEAEFKKDLFFYRPESNGNGVNGSGVHDIFTASREGHRRQRRLIAHAFSDTALSEQQDLIGYYVDLLMQRLREVMMEGKEVDITRWYNYTTFDIIGDLAFGDPFHCLETSTMHPWVNMIFQFIKSGSKLRTIAGYPLLMPFRRFLMGSISHDAIGENLALTSAKLKKRLDLGAGAPKKDFLSYILKANDEKSMNFEEMLGNSEAFVVAGSETTATALSGLTYYLSRNPEAWGRLKTEIQETFKSDKDITLRSVAMLPYLCACVEEILRIYPPATITPPRISPGANINGEYIPEGTKIWINQWSTCHRECNFLQADDFIPERHLSPSHPLYDVRYANDNRASMAPFSTGPRNCVGKNLAYAEMRLITAKLAWNFELELMPQSYDWMEGQKVFTVFEKPPLFIKLHSGERVGRLGG